MKVCPNCFADIELKAFVSSSSQKGDCDICASKETPLLDLNELLDFFQELTNNFQVVDKGEDLKAKIQSNWNFFSSLDVAEKVLNYVLPQVKTQIKNASTKVDFNQDILENYQYWDELKEELKWSKRFLSNLGYITEELGWDGFFNSQFELDKEDTYYRARVHHESGMPAYELDKMGCPPPKKVNGGRANPLGIPYLYLSDNEETVLYEIRASYLDEVSVGYFQIASDGKPLNIVDFTKETALYQPNRVNEIIKAHLLKKHISKDLSKPMRRYDSEIEYIPTQFICEFIKVITGASGILFASSVHTSGKNLVLFDEKLMKCVDVNLRKIDSLQIEAIDITHTKVK